MAHFPTFPMRTGFGIGSEIEDPVISNEDLLRLLGVFMENAVANALEYSVGSGRDNLSSMDIVYGLKYEAYSFCKRGTFQDYLAAEETESEGSEATDSEGSEATDSEDAEEFTEAPDNISDLIKNMNEVHAFWSTWQPDNDIERLLKKSIDDTILKNESLAH